VGISVVLEMGRGSDKEDRSSLEDDCRRYASSAVVSMAREKSKRRGEVLKSDSVY
jgi:hypothetical protein